MVYSANRIPRTNALAAKKRLAALLRPGQVQVPAELSVDVSAHGFLKRGTTVMFSIRIVNLDAGSYLQMTPEKALAKTEKKK